MPASKKSRFSFERKHWVILFCLIGLLAFALAYLFVYIPSNEKYLNERRFNAMRRIETNIDAKQSNTFQLIKSLTRSLAEPNQKINRQVLENYLDSGFSHLEPLVFDQVVRFKRKDTTLNGHAVSKNTIDTETSYTNGNIQFSGQKNYKDSAVLLRMNYTVERFFEPLLLGAGFDEFVVVMNGEIIYETFPSGLNGSRFDSLLQINKNLVGANSRQLKIAGLDYQAFIQPFALGQVTQGCFIMGLVHYEKFQSERVQLPAKQVIVIITTGFLIIILLPWLKLFNLGSKDRLTLYDGALSFVVAMLLVSITFMGFASLAVRYQSHNHLTGLENIAESIESRNSDYFKQIKQSLDSLDALVYRDSNLRTNIIELDDLENMKRGTQYVRNPAYESNITQDQKLKIHSIIQHTPVFQVFWLNKENGFEVFNWSTDNYNAPTANLSRRNYFINQRDTLEPYSADQVISWTTGLFRTIIAKQSKDPAMIACVSFPLISVEKSILPEGYAFAITDRNGEVLYHANAMHNLNENVPEETSDPDKVKSAISSHAAQHIETKYKGTDSRLFIRPVSLDGITYWVIVTYDKQYESVMDTGAFSFTLFMTLLFFLIVFIQMVLVVFISARKSRLNAIRIETDWIWPRPSLHKVYHYASIYQLCIFMLLFLIYYYANFLGFLFILILSLSLVTLFINFLYLRKYQKEKRITIIRYKKRNIVALFSIQAIINFFAIWQLVDDFASILLLILFQIAGFTIAKMVFNKFCNDLEHKHTTSDNTQGLKRDVFINSYARLAITRLIISSGLPVFFFYQYAYNNQLSIQAHYKQLSYAWKILDKKVNTKKQPVFNSLNHYPDNYWIKNIDNHNNFIHPNNPLKADSISVLLLNRYRIYNTEISRKTDAFAPSSIQDSAYSFFPVNGRFSWDTGFSSYVRIRPNQSVYLSSENISFKYPVITSVPVALYWILFLLALFILYLIIKRVIQQIFALDVPGEISPYSLAKKVMGFSTGSKLTYITGLPGARKMRFIRESTSPADRVIIDLFKNPPDNLFWKDAKAIVFNHFEYILQDKNAITRFLGLLEEMLVSNEKPAIIIVSTVHPDRAVSMISRLVNEDNSTSNTPIKERFQILLGHFNAITLPILPSAIEVLDEWERKHQQKWMDNEFSISPFIERLRLPLKEAYFKERREDIHTQTHKKNKWLMPHWWHKLSGWFDDSGSETGDTVIWSLQNIAVIFYQHIWQSLSPEERYLVYDLAEEGLVNQSDKYHLSMLIQKGLIKRKEPFGQLELMNDSFKNFVLVSVNKAEALQLKNELKAESSWSDLRSPIMLVIVGIMAIMLASQQQAFSTIIGYLTAIAAIIPTLNAIFSLIKPATPGKT